MFPTPVQQRSAAWQTTYRALLPLALFLWLLPLLMVALFSIKPDTDFTQGNLWGWPSTFAGFENYTRVFTDSAMPRYLLNSRLHHRAHGSSARWRCPA